MTKERKMKKSKKIFLVILLVIAAAVTAEFIYSNSVIDVEKISYNNEQIPKSFDGAVIVHISDYHSHGGSYEDRLIEKVKEQNPDYVFITGDIIDAKSKDIDAAKSFLKKVSETAECYLVWGNHDHNVGGELREQMKKCCEDSGIKVLEDETVFLERDGEKILLAGTSDYLYSDSVDEMMKNYPKEKQFTMWLHHYPEDFKEIVNMTKQAGCQADLIFTGHAHGGLFRFPFVKGLYAPGQGFFPEYTSGKYELDGSEMIVSRGVGNSGYTRRFGDNFHLISVTLGR